MDIFLSIIEKIQTGFQNLTILQQITAVSISIISVITFYQFWKKKKDTKIIAGYPPGPKGYPFIGAIELTKGIRKK